MYRILLETLLKKIYIWLLDEHKLFMIEPKNPKDVIYVIRFYRKEGLMSILYKACEQLEYASMKGYTPYIDMKHFPTIYHTDGNAWECFFEQPAAKEKLNRKGKKYILAWTARAPKTKWYEVYWAEAFSNYKEKYGIYRKNIFIKEDIRKEIDKLAAELRIEECIGLLVRGTDYVSLKPKGHPIQPKLSAVMKKVDEYIEKYKTKCFLVTEDKGIKEQLFAKYGERIFSIPDDMTIETYRENRMLGDIIPKNKSIIIGQRYLEKIVLLSRCKYLIASKTNGSLMALIMNHDSYADCYLFDLGMYGEKTI